MSRGAEDMLLVCKRHYHVDNWVDLIGWIAKRNACHAVWLCIISILRVLEDSRGVVNIDSLGASNCNSLTILKRTNLVDLHAGVEREHWSTGYVLFYICYLPDTNFAVFSRSGEEEIAVIGHCYCVNWVCVLVKRRHECSLKFMLQIWRRFPLAPKLVGNLHCLNLISVSVFEMRQHWRLSRQSWEPQLLINLEAFENSKI